MELNSHGASCFFTLRSWIHTERFFSNQTEKMIHTAWKLLIEIRTGKIDKKVWENQVTGSSYLWNGMESC